MGSISWSPSHLAGPGQPLQPASAPSPGSQRCSWGLRSPARTLRSTGSPGKGPAPGQGPGTCAPMLKAFSPKLTNQFFHPLRCFCLKTVILHDIILYTTETREHLWCTHFCHNLLAFGFVCIW